MLLSYAFFVSVPGKKSRMAQNWISLQGGVDVLDLIPGVIIMEKHPECTSYEQHERLFAVVQEGIVLGVSKPSSHVPHASSIQARTWSILRIDHEI